MLFNRGIRKQGLRAVMMKQIKGQTQKFYSLGVNKNGFMIRNNVFYFGSQQNKKPDHLDSYSFEQLILLKSTQSLTKAAQKMASLQLQNEDLDKQIQILQQKMLTYPQHHQALMQRIKSIMDNITLQQQQNENIQQRAQKQLIDSRNYAISKVAREVLQISDNLQRSIKHSQSICKHTHGEAMRFYGDLQKIFRRFGIQSFNPTNQPFDPNKQQSLQKISLPSGSDLTQQERLKKSNTVYQCLRTGYMIKGRLLRSAHVVVYQ